MKISFLNTIMPKVTVLGTVSFPAMVDNEYVWCEISCEVLKTHFDAISLNENDLLYTFHNNRSEIEGIAHEHLMENGGHPILLMLADFKENSSH